VNRALEGLTGRVEVALTVMAGFVLAAVLPVMLTSTADPSGTAAAVLALAVTVLFAVGMRRFSLPTPVHAALPPAADGVPPVLPGRITDPLHHPLRPRAPGLA
jgi:hypothetical protein